MDIRFDPAEASKESAKGGNNNSAGFDGWRQPRTETAYMSDGET
jgi:hypothetical protein